MIATIILLGFLFIQLGINLNRSESMSEALVSVLACVTKFMLYYFAGLFDKFM